MNRPDDNPKSAFGITKPPLSLIPPAAEIHLAVVMGLGAAKYGAFNWRTNSVSAQIYIDAAKRHIAAWWDGESDDPESGASHLAHAMACLAIIIDAGECRVLLDDRPPIGSAAALVRRFAARYTDLIKSSGSAAPESGDSGGTSFGALEGAPVQ